MDFCFLNDNSVFATISVSPKPSFSIWDTLMPPTNVKTLIQYYALEFGDF